MDQTFVNTALEQIEEHKHEIKKLRKQIHNHKMKHLMKEKYKKMSEEQRQQKIDNVKQHTLKKKIENNETIYSGAGRPKKK